MFAKLKGKAVCHINTYWSITCNLCTSGDGHAFALSYTYKYKVVFKQLIWRTNTIIAVRICQTLFVT